MAPRAGLWAVCFLSAAGWTLAIIVATNAFEGQLASSSRSQPAPTRANSSAEIDGLCWTGVTRLFSQLQGPIALLVERQAAIGKAIEVLWDTFRPGGRLHPAYFFEHQGHIVVEAALLGIIAYLLTKPSSRPDSKKERPLTEEEVDELCAEWMPEPLHGAVTEEQAAFAPPVLSTGPDTTVVANGARVLNMASFNFLGLAGDPAIKEASAETIRKYGVGSCGPRGFYGTFDVHLDLEARLARLMGTEESIIYSYDLATLPSVLPAFASAKDIIVCDAGVNYSIQNGCNLSRAQVRTFIHNNAVDLERVLQSVAADDRRHPRRPLNRRFVVVEGVYARSGDLAPLKAIAALAQRFKWRLVVDESLALGVLGRRGRGACEAAGLAPGAVDIVAASLGNALGAAGGFCAGRREVVDHQRLSGLGYCFSASLPPFLASAALRALDALEARGPALRAALVANIRTARAEFCDIPGLEMTGGPAADLCPIIHLRPKPAPGAEGPGASSAGVEAAGARNRAGVADVNHMRNCGAAAGPAPSGGEDREAVLQAVVDDALARGGALFSLSRRSPLDAVALPLQIRVAVTAKHTEKELQRAAAALRAAALRHLPQLLPVGGVGGQA